MKKYGLIGERLSHSFSPILHEIIFQNSQIKGQYKLHEVEREKLGEKIGALRNLELDGFNVTIPYKEEVLGYLDEISPEAEMIGAVNTLSYRDGKLIGDNTDYYGFGALLRKADIELRGDRALIIGSGGSSKSVYHYLKNNGIGEVVFVSRRPQDVDPISKDVNIIDYNGLKSIANMDIIINTSPVGMYPNLDECPVDRSVLINCKAAVDLIYNPLETKFLKIARECGLKRSNGLYMLVAQGIKSQEIWNGIEFDLEFYDRVFKGVLEYVK